MIKLALIFLLSWYCNVSEIEKIRANYIRAVSDKELCFKMIEDCKSKKNKPIYLGYLGGFQALSAKHVLAPWAKLKSFNEGKQNINQAIIQEPQNVELRYIRLSIQKNAPVFLTYRNEMESDTKFIKENLCQIKDKVVLRNIAKLINN